MVLQPVAIVKVNECSKAENHYDVDGQQHGTHVDLHIAISTAHKHIIKHSNFSPFII